jgi:hypothetical protein
MTTCSMLIRAPVTMTSRLAVSSIGQYEGAGMWTGPGPSRRESVGRFPVSSPPYLRSQKSSRSCTVGIRAKFQGGGGEGMDHSSVRPSQGSGPASAPERVVFATLTRNTTKDSAIKKAPTVETRFQKFQPRSSAYV